MSQLTIGSASRRRFIGTSIALVGAPVLRAVGVLVTAPAKSIAADAAGRIHSAAPYRVLNRGEASFTEAIVNVLCPADRLTPDGVSCGLALAVDRELAVRPAADVRRFRGDRGRKQRLSVAVRDAAPSPGRIRRRQIRAVGVRRRSRRERLAGFLGSRGREPCAYAGVLHWLHLRHLFQSGLLEDLRVRQTDFRRLTAAGIGDGNPGPRPNCGPDHRLPGNDVVMPFAQMDIGPSATGRAGAEAEGFAQRRYLRALKKTRMSSSHSVGASNAGKCPPRGMTV